MKSAHAQHRSVLSRVLTEDWFGFTPSDNQVIESLILTGHIVRTLTPGNYPRRKMHITADGYAYLEWLRVQDPPLDENAPLNARNNV